MLDVFIADADATQRSALRWGIGWEELGFSCSGEAADGEMALAQMRRQPPDLLITDLYLPYLDGLELCRRVRQEFPRTRLMICTWSKNLRDLQRSIEVGVDAYLFKGAQPEELRSAVERSRRRLEEEQARESELKELRERAMAYQEYQRDVFFRSMVSNAVSVSQLYDQAQELGVDLRADEYCFLLLLIRPDMHREEDWPLIERTMADLEALFRSAPRVECFPFMRTMLALLITGDAGHIDTQVSFCMRNIRRGLLSLGEEHTWVAAQSNPVNRVSALPFCFAQAQEVLAYSVMEPGQQVFTPAVISSLRSEELDSLLRRMPPPIPLSEELDLYMKNGTPEEALYFARRCVDGLGPETIQIPEICRYLMLRIRLSAMAYVNHTLHLDMDSLLSAVDGMPPIERIYGREGTMRYLRALLERTTQLRDASRWSRYHSNVRQGLRCIDQHFTEPHLSLAQVAEAAGLSPNYFSTLFRREVGCTFGEYLTQKRISRARNLLRSTAMRTAQVAQAVGYQDAHYFSTLFRRNQGCTPREYRNRMAARG